MLHVGRVGVTPMYYSFNTVSSQDSKIRSIKSVSLEMTAEYRITIQRNINRTIHDSGAVTINLTLNQEQVLGIMAAIYLVSPERFNRIIEILRLSNNTILTSDLYSHGIYLLGDIVTYLSLNELRERAERRGRPENIVLNPLDIGAQQRMFRRLDYWCILTKKLDPPMNIRRIYIVQFETPSFLQGVITGLNWFGLDWHNHIMLIYHNNRPEEIVGFAE